MMQLTKTTLFPARSGVMRDFTLVMEMLEREVNKG